MNQASNMKKHKSPRRARSATAVQISRDSESESDEDGFDGKSGRCSKKPYRSPLELLVVAGCLIGTSVVLFVSDILSDAAVLEDDAQRVSVENLQSAASNVRHTASVKQTVQSEPSAESPSIVAAPSPSPRPLPPPSPLPRAPPSPPPIGPPQPAFPPPTSPSPVPASWTFHKGLNCYPGHGAEDIDAKGPAEVRTLAACKSLCEAEQRCEAIVVLRKDSSCYRKSALHLSRCANDGVHAIADTYAIHRPFPPPPPPPPFVPSAFKSADGPRTPVRAMFDRWYADTNSRFWSMWGGAYQQRFPHTAACWDWDPDPAFWEHTYAGTTCDRNWLAGAVGGAFDRPFFPNSPALLGFDETINEFCSAQLAIEPWDGTDLNHAIAHRCRDARRNVLRDLQGAWSMCVNLQWQLCAVQGKLPSQGSNQVSFATAPRDLKAEWWEDPANNPILGKWLPFGCCGADRFTVADVYFAELFVMYSICVNGADIFTLDAGELFTCDLGDGSNYKLLQAKFTSS
ncbi:hypothetical protein AB1Y20_021072 [Prymnesium parvum]|uniref:Apple domain-containing protein n=1 Tax=Prymnesium parvum TaxID=97485 RepID=A0AB34JKA6_PRYPA